MWGPAIPPESAWQAGFGATSFFELHSHLLRRPSPHWVTHKCLAHFSANSSSFYMTVFVYMCIYIWRLQWLKNLHRFVSTKCRNIWCKMMHIFAVLWDFTNIWPRHYLNGLTGNFDADNNKGYIFEENRLMEQSMASFYRFYGLKSTEICKIWFNSIKLT